MSDHQKRTDLESQIDVLIRRAEDALRQQLHDLPRCHTAEFRQDQDQAPLRPLSGPASGDPDERKTPQETPPNKTSVVKTSIFHGGHKASHSLEDAIWKELREIASERHMKVSELAHTISTEREKGT